MTAEPSTASTPTQLHWLDGQPPTVTGVTWGVPWGPGDLPRTDDLRLLAGDRPVPMDSWVTARWPDGSVKWSAHAIGAQDEVAESYRLLRLLNHRLLNHRLLNHRRVHGSRRPVTPSRWTPVRSRL